MSALWQPTWQPSTAYAVKAVVIPTTFGGFTWRCTTAGTSGGSEPTWPDPSVSETVTDGGVTWTVGSGFRQAIHDGLVSLIKAFAAANPTIIRTVRSVRPLSFANVELPCFFIGDLSETLTHSQGVRTRTMAGFSAYLVDALGSVDESDDRMNFAADALADLFSGGVHAASGRSVFEHTATNDTEIPEAGVTYPALEFMFGRTEVQEGRA